MKTIELIVGNNIRLRRKKLKLSQTDLAENADLSLQTVHRMEAGSQTPRKENLKSVAKALGCTVEDLYKDSENKPVVISQKQMAETILSLTSELEALKNHPFWIAYETATPENQGKALALLESKPQAVDDIEKRARDLLRQADEALGRTPAKKKGSR